MAIVIEGPYLAGSVLRAALDRPGEGTERPEHANWGLSSRSTQLLNAVLGGASKPAIWKIVKQFIAIGRDLSILEWTAFVADGIGQGRERGDEIERVDPPDVCRGSLFNAGGGETQASD
jgi:hypothetical protein